MDQSGIIGKVCRQYADREVLSVRELGEGHINDSFFVNTEDGEYIIQRLQKKMDISRLEYNYLLYSEAFEKNGFSCPTFIRDREGRFFYNDPDGDNWRMYPFIPGDILTPPLSDKELYECGRGLAKLHAILQPLSKSPMAVYPMLRDLGFYYTEYEKLRISDGFSKENRDPSIEEKIRSDIGKYLDHDRGYRGVVHGDPKLSNILFREGKVTGFLDLDTVMTGFLSEDIADCIRSCCVSGGKPDKETADLLLEGYAEVAGKDKTNEIRKNLPDTIRKIMFELGLRYYTDAISKEKKFKEKYPGYRLERAKFLFVYL